MARRRRREAPQVDEREDVREALRVNAERFLWGADPVDPYGDGLRALSDGQLRRFARDHARENAHARTALACLDRLREAA